MEQATNDVRAELIRDLRSLADLLEARPDLPINNYPWMKLQYSTSGDIDEVRRVAAILGVDVDETDDAVTARLELGCVEYLAYASTDLGKARHDAFWSYRDSVEPNLVSAS